MNRKHGYSIPILPLIMIACCGLCAAADRNSPAQPGAQPGDLATDARAAVQLALPHVARQTGEWIEQKKCTSCHQVPHSLWAMNEARARGFTVDDRLASWNRWSVAFVLEKAEAAAGSGDRADELYQMLLAGPLADADSEPQGEDRSASMRDRLLASLRSARNQDGSWHAGGQLPDQKRSKQETNEVTTMWSRLALRWQHSLAERQAAGDEHKTRHATASGRSLEHLVLRYLLSLENEATDRAALQDQILANQNEDGGWGWLLQDPSDALATGQALYALSHPGAPGPDHRQEAVNRARRFLVRTQRPDGSWQVPSTLLDKANQTYTVSNDWGTAWAVIGLTRTLEPQAISASD